MLQHKLTPFKRGNLGFVDIEPFRKGLAEDLTGKFSADVRCDVKKIGRTIFAQEVEIKDARQIMIAICTDLKNIEDCAYESHILSCKELNFEIAKIRNAAELIDNEQQELLVIANQGDTQGISWIAVNLNSWVDRVFTKLQKADLADGAERLNNVSKVTSKHEISEASRSIKELYYILEACHDNVLRDPQYYLFEPRNAKSGLPANAIDTVLLICSRFYLYARELQERQKGEPIHVKNEYDVQDFLRCQLRTHFETVQPEEWIPEYLGSQARIDFVLPDHGIAIECKMTRETLKQKKLGEELIVDCARYSQKENINTLVCFIYDPEYFIKNATKFCKELAELSKDSLRIIGVISPGFDIAR